MKKRLISVLLISVFLLTLLAGCGSSAPAPSGSSSGEASQKTESSAPAASDEKVYTFSYGCVGNEDEATYRGALVWKQYVEEHSNGRIKFETYPNGTLGDDRQLLESVQMGQLMSMSTGLTQQTNFVPELSVMDVPFAFSTEEDVANLFADEEFWAYLSNLYAEKGFKLIGESFQGFRTLTSNKPVYSVDDCKGLDIRVIESPTPMAIWSATGASPTPVSFNELYTALQQGVVDAQENPIQLIYAMKFYEQQKYIIDTNHQIQPILWVVNLDFWNNLPADLQQILQDGMQEAANFCNSALDEENAKMVEDMEAAGVEMIYLTDEARQGFKDATASVWPMLQEKYPEFYDVFTSALNRTQK